MNVKRFVGRNSREAMARVRAAFGDDAVVLSNRPCDEGVEILALPGAAIDSLTHERGAAAPAQASVPAQETVDGSFPADRMLSERATSGRDDAPRTLAERAQRALGVDRAERALGDGRSERIPAMKQGERAPGLDRSERTAGADRRAAAQPMSTVSFEDYVRDRLARRQAAAQPWPDDEIPVLHERLTEPQPAAPVPAMPEPFQSAAPSQGVAPIAPVPAAARAAGAAARHAHDLRAELMREMRALRGFIGEQVSSLAWLDGVRRDPLQTRVLRQLLDNGFSAAVTRKLASQLPADCTEQAARDWLQHVVARNIRSDADGELLDRGGVFAIVGPTGVGKTTTTAKIAAQFALRHGTQSIGLITVDHYRVGAHDQLRAFGRILGVPVHTAHDEATLNDFLQIFAAKKLVLIDTVGVSQRDERVAELLAALSAPAIRRLVVLNAAAQAATIEDVVSAYCASDAAGVVISKIDEAVTLGGVVDCVMRHRLRVAGVADGQRVPEDWHAMPAEELARRALAERARSVFTLDEAELPAMWALSGTMEPAHA